MARSDVVHIRNAQRTVAGCVVLAVIFGMVAYSVARRPDVQGYVGLAVIGLIMALAAIRIIRAGVVVDSHGVVVRNWTATHRVPWSNVAGFSPTQDDDRHHTVGLALVDGRRIGCFALGNLGGLVNFIDGKLTLTDQNPAVDRFAEAIEARVGRRAEPTRDVEIAVPDEAAASR